MTTEELPPENGGPFGGCVILDAPQSYLITVQRICTVNGERGRSEVGKFIGATIKFDSIEVPLQKSQGQINRHEQKAAPPGDHAGLFQKERCAQVDFLFKGQLAKSLWAQVYATFCRLDTRKWEATDVSIEF